jgi:uncharacterized membrane protein YkvA (DUF1232 family)
MAPIMPVHPALTTTALVEVVLAALLGVILLWLALVATLCAVGRRERQSTTTLRDALRLLPDVVRLLRRLAGDPDLPRGVRLRLGAVLVYLALPVDLVPDFVPFVGYADDAIVVALALRSVVRRAGVDALDRHWPGTTAGLDTVRRLAGLPARTAGSEKPAERDSTA